VLLRSYLAEYLKPLHLKANRTCKKSDIPMFGSVGFHLIEKLKGIKQVYASLDNDPDDCTMRKDKEAFLPPPFN